MIDENAYGFLLSYHNIENDEYSLERDDFATRFRLFRSTVLEYLSSVPLGARAKALDLGHAVYVEVAQGDEECDPFQWLKGARERLAGLDFVTVAVLTHGSRWAFEHTAPDETVTRVGGATLTSASTPSEPLRRSLYAEAASQPDDQLQTPGWGPGLYVDAEAIEAMGRKLKNAPTPLCAAGATYYRVGT